MHIMQACVDKPTSQPDLRCLQTHCFRQPGLAIVERPESLCAQFEGAGDMQAVESPCAEFCTISLGEISAKIPGIFRQLDSFPDPSLEVSFKVLFYFSEICGVQLAAKNMLRQSMGALRAVKRSTP